MKIDDQYNVEVMIMMTNDILWNRYWSIINPNNQINQKCDKPRREGNVSMTNVMSANEMTQYWYWRK